MEVPAATEDAAAPWLVYVLAHQRSRPYIIGVGRDLEQIGYDAFEHASRIMKSANRYSRDPFLLMWYEAQPGRDEALARAAQIRRWPHAWQRRLVETGNPQWLEQWKQEIGVSPLFWAQVPEISPRASLPRIADSARSCRRLRSLHYLCPVPSTCADPQPPASPEPTLPAQPLRPRARSRNFIVRNVPVSALLIAPGISCCIAFDLIVARIDEHRFVHEPFALLPIGAAAIAVGSLIGACVVVRRLVHRARAGGERTPASNATAHAANRAEADPAPLHGLPISAAGHHHADRATRHSCATRAAHHAGAPPASTRRDQGLIQLFDTASIDNSLTLSP